jgi:four helix bundle protein
MTYGERKISEDPQAGPRGQNQQTRNQQTRAEPGYNYRNLDLWEDAQAIAADVVRLVASLRRDTSALVITQQLVKASGSIAANIAEGHGRFTPAAYRNHLSIAKGSACEADSWINLLLRGGYIDAAQENELHQRLLSVIARLTRQMRELEMKMEQKRTPGIREEGADYDPSL